MSQICIKLSDGIIASVNKIGLKYYYQGVLEAAPGALARVTRSSIKRCLIFVVIILVSCGHSVGNRRIGDISTRGPISLTRIIETQNDRLQYCLTPELNHIESWNVIDTVTRYIDQEANYFQASISSSLPEAAHDAYFAERDAFSRWQAYQQILVKDVVFAKWELYVGGTSGGDLLVGHLFNVASINNADQQMLWMAIIKDPHLCIDRRYSATSHQIEQAIDSLKFDFYWANWIGANEDNRFDITKLEEEIDSDYTLFSEWMSKREVLRNALPEYCKDVISSTTDYWRHFYCKHFLEGLITNPLRNLTE